jgi:hypothetical protein
LEERPLNNRECSKVATESPKFRVVSSILTPVARKNKLTLDILGKIAYLLNVIFMDW